MKELEHEGQRTPVGGFFSRGWVVEVGNGLRMDWVEVPL